MKKYKLSPWHDGSVKPVHVGVYQTKTKGDMVDIYQYWDGKFWGYMAWEKDGAVIGSCLRSESQKPKWRGILK